MESEAKCKRACDRCRFKRVRCRREGECCLRCIKDNKVCLFADEEKKRGPKPKAESPLRKRRSRAKFITSPSSEDALSAPDISPKELFEHDAHTATFFHNRETVAMWIQSFFRQVDPSMQLVNHTLLNHIMVTIPNPSFRAPFALVFLLRCMAACAILVTTSNPLDDLFLVHYDMAVKALRVAHSPELVEAVAAGIDILNIIDYTIESSSH
ncbi:hypothetical protein DSO57_1003340 [Entomophthora muscae]|uniref:Uncharacterized protein n=1 Tax=Entomophthora muscae TaxID=34485 RepID=A0ACC2U6B7_9FUNG|nr:hypothetical protein DSO57_1003340 [Entomophthora muscae]